MDSKRVMTFTAPFATNWGWNIGWDGMLGTETGRREIEDFVIVPTHFHKKFNIKVSVV